MMFVRWANDLNQFSDLFKAEFVKPFQESLPKKGLQYSVCGLKRALLGHLLSGYCICHWYLKRDPMVKCEVNFQENLLEVYDVFQGQIEQVKNNLARINHDVDASVFVTISSHRIKLKINSEPKVKKQILDAFDPLLSGKS